ncbi:MAG: cation:proton antiporter [Acidobacteria bacterium]|nr:MAG: cation:proton antiporter [Acidobacteriota bacterium]
MRQIIILALLFFITYALQFLQWGSESELNPKSMASLGFILLAAYVAGGFFARFKLPKISGYIVTGIVCGPYVINLLSKGVVSDLRVLDDLALGLIALTAGGELKLTALRRDLKSVLYIIGFLVIVVFAGVTACVLAARPLLPFLSESPLTTIAVALCFGITAVATSPASTIAIITETRASGIVTERVLSITVIKDVLVVIAFAFILSIAKHLSLEPTIGQSAVTTVFTEVAASLLMGVVLGVLTVLYIRYINAEMLLFIIGLVFAGTAFAHWLELEAILMFMVAGFVVENFSSHGQELIETIERASLPVYVVFFAIAGAGINLPVLRQTLLIASILVAVRLLTTYLGTFLGSALAGDPPQVRRYAWMGFITQAGVSLGLATIVEQTFPTWGPHFKTLIVATIAMNLIIGPIAFKVALDRSGETEEMRERTLTLAEQPAPGP